MNIYSGNQFVIDRKLNNPADSGTYFVRAVIKNTLTGATIATLNLADNGNKYFSLPWLVPGDPSGQGLQISVLTTAYTDAYVSESFEYGTELQTYLIQNPTPQLGGIGGGFFDYEGLSGLFEKMIKAQLAALLKEIQGSQKDFDYLKLDASLENFVAQYTGELGIRIGDRISLLEDGFAAFTQQITTLLSTIVVPDIKPLEESITTAADSMRKIADTIIELKGDFDGSIGVHATIAKQIKEVANAMTKEIGGLRNDIKIKNETLDLVSKVKSLVSSTPEIEPEKIPAPPRRPLTNFFPQR